MCTSPLAYPSAPHVSEEALLAAEASHTDGEVPQ